MSGLSNRQSQILEKVTELTATYAKEKDFDMLCSINAEKIAEALFVDRTLASRGLNQLLEAGYVVKVKGRPVSYMSREELEKTVKAACPEEGFFENQDAFYLWFHQKLKDTVKNEKVSNSENNQAFDCLIGSDGSLRRQVEIAKAAVLYPPNGLHTMIVGQTGVGKSAFAEAMYRYALETGILDNKAPFVVFNCADYANNPQLLVSHLFGHAKGAFTGAEKDHTGLVKRADNGILFLDEIHRLPPEGQEMLFSLIDKGEYYRLGETQIKQTANIRLIGATTENIESVCLNTFIRRIPVIIDLPPLEKRGQMERIKMIYMFFEEEAIHIDKDISVSSKVLQALAGYDFTGNIGQLKSNIKYICARAFLSYVVNNDSVMRIEMEHLPSAIAESIMRSRTDYKESSPVVKKTLSQDALFSAKGNRDSQMLQHPYDSHKYDLDYYDEIVKNWESYLSSGLETEEAFSRTSKKIEHYFGGILTELGEGIEQENRFLVELVEEKVLNSVRVAMQAVKDFLPVDMNQVIFHGLAMHLHNFMQHPTKGIDTRESVLKKIQKDYPDEYIVANKLVEIFQENLRIEMPVGELVFITMLLYAAGNMQKEFVIGILVIAHGDSTASSMVNFAKKMTTANHIQAIDIPYDEPVQETIQKSIQQIKKLDSGKGVIVLADIGTPVRFEQVVTKETGIKVLCVPNVTMSTILEALYRTAEPEMTLEQLKAHLNFPQYIEDDPVEFDIEHPEKMELSNYVSYMPRMLVPVLTFLDSGKVCKVLGKSLEKALEIFGQQMDKGILLKYFFHCACMIERLIRGISWDNKNLEKIRTFRTDTLEQMRSVLEIIENEFCIDLPDSEIALIVETFDAHYGCLIKPCIKE